MWKINNFLQGFLLSSGNAWSGNCSPILGWRHVGVAENGNDPMIEMSRFVKLHVETAISSLYHLVDNSEYSTTRRGSRRETDQAIREERFAKRYPRAHCGGIRTKTLVHVLVPHPVLECKSGHTHTRSLQVRPRLSIPWFVARCGHRETETRCTSRQKASLELYKN